MVTSSLGRADHVHHGLRFGASLYEIVGLGKNALAERFLVAFNDGNALFHDERECLFLDREAVVARIRACVSA